MKYVPWKNYKTITADLKEIYQATIEDEALFALEHFGDKWDEKYPQDIRRAIYTTNTIESLNSVIRKRPRNVNCSQQMNRLERWCT